MNEYTTIQLKKEISHIVTLYSNVYGLSKPEALEKFIVGNKEYKDFVNQMTKRVKLKEEK